MERTKFCLIPDLLVSQTKIFLLELNHESDNLLSYLGSPRRYSVLGPIILLSNEFLKAGCFEAGKVIPTDERAPQGGNVSPMLSTLFLRYVLDLWFEKKVIPQVEGACYMVRHADVRHLSPFVYSRHYPLFYKALE